jgi:NADH-quinone oxidoreductase subunit F
MPAFEPILTRNYGVANSQTLATYKSRGGYSALEKAVKTMTPEQVVDAVIKSGLRGRGGAGFPCGTKWTFLPKDRKVTYLAVNADESEPGTFNNRTLLDNDPHQLIEGIALASYAIKAQKAYCYLRVEFHEPYAALAKAVEEACAAGYIGKKVAGSDFSFDLILHRGAGAYICGEETGLLESLEGKRGWPRIKPPFPAIQGLFAKPTIVNNVETLCCVPHIIARGPEWFASIGIPPKPPDPNKPGDRGSPGSTGPKLFTVAGHVNKPGCFELPLGVSVKELVEKHAGGVRGGKKWKAVIPGGISMGILTADEAEKAVLDFESLRPKPYDCLGLGTAAVVVMDETTEMADVLYNTARFFSHESCGQCTQCREGTGWMYKIARRIRAGAGRLEDLDLIAELTANMGMMPGMSICGLPDGAAYPIRHCVTKFRAELEGFIRSRRKIED